MTISIMRSEFESRLRKIQNVIGEAQADACIITSPVNLFYLNGFIFDGYMYIRPENEPVLFVKRPHGVKAENVFYIRKPEQMPEMLQQKNFPLPEKILVEADSMVFSSAVRLQNALGNPQLINVSAKIRELRSVKSDYELAQMRECAAIHTTVYKEIPGLYREGMTDIELQIEIERVMRLHGSMGIFRAFGENMDIFMGSLLAGNNAQTASPYDFALGGRGLSPLLPIGSSGVKLEKGTTFMVDMAGNFRPWMSDMSRTFAIGKADKKAYDAHQVSMEMNHWVSENVKPGTACAAIYDYSLATAKKHGLESYFMGTKQQARFVGHGLGLEINEPPVLTPRSREILQPGMAFAYEPKFVLPGIGPVGIENTFIVEQNGVENITLCEEKLITL
ncbi:MAG: Xaa-Pro peptidase family protein [Petrimonas sp.]|nr:Xaa-Pro peptidase family protein [Petrimonas sp.]